MGEPAEIDVDDGGVRCAESVLLLKRGPVDFFDRGKRVAAGFGQANEFFEPRSAGGLQMNARACIFQGLADGA